MLSALSVLVVAQSSSEIPEGLINNPVYVFVRLHGAEQTLQLSTGYIEHLTIGGRDR